LQVSAAANSTAPTFQATAEVLDAAGQPYDSILSWGPSFTVMTDGNYCGAGDYDDPNTGCGDANPSHSAMLVPAFGRISGFSAHMEHTPTAASFSFTIRNLTSGQDVPGMNLTIHGNGELGASVPACTDAA